MSQTADVVIVGSGAGGAPLALRLSQAGYDVLVLEKGPRYERTDYIHDELLALSRPGFFVPDVRDEPHVVVDVSKGVRELSTLGWIASCVGGGTSHMGGACFRFHPDDFRLRSRFGLFHQIADWPYSYESLEHYYAVAEWEVGVSGRAGVNPYDGPRSASYPMPPLDTHDMAGEFSDACSKRGWHPFPTPRAINSQPYQGRPACTYCSFCAGFGCPTGARGSTAEALLPRAEATGRCKLHARSNVHEVTLDRQGRANGCIYFDDHGVEHRVSARVVCVSCSAVESARLLLMSRPSTFPDGLANSSGLVGKNLQFQAASAGRAEFRPGRPSNTRRFQLGSVMDSYFLDTQVGTLPKGGLHKFEVRRPQPIGTAQRWATGSIEQPVLWGTSLKAALRRRLLNSLEVSVEVFHDFLPNMGTRVDLDPIVTDKWGLPVARIFLDVPVHQRTVGQLLLDDGLSVLSEMGAVSVATEGVGYVNSAMAHGTCRAGEHPRDSVLGPFCEAHDVPNLFVVDGSFMPTSGGVPSTLTIIANSLRVSDFIVATAAQR